MPVIAAPPGLHRLPAVLGGTGNGSGMLFGFEARPKAARRENAGCAGRHNSTRFILTNLTTLDYG
ncbi:MAG TPA: hypothetical protein PLN97_00225 [Verrucomicrobiota bacterium]|nr:hypothetical protein [Verrucomicrobiota bacterium]